MLAIEACFVEVPIQNKICMGVESVIFALEHKRERV